MSVVFDFKEAQKLRQARMQPNLSFVPFSLAESLANIKAEHFPDVSHQVEAHFVGHGPLACGKWQTTWALPKLSIGECERLLTPGRKMAKIAVGKGGRPTMPQTDHASQHIS